MTTEIPWSDSAERSVVGAVILRPEALAWLDVEPADFYSPPNRKIWEACAALHGRGEPVDPVTLEAELTRAGTLEAVGGLGRLADACEYVPTAANVEAYAAELRRLRISRDVLLAAASVRQHVAEGTHGEALLDLAMRSLSAISAPQRTEGVTATDAMRTEYRQIVEDLDRDQPPGVQTGIGVLDRAIGGFPLGIPTVIGARPSIGKTSLTLSIAANAAASDVGVHVFTWEDRIPGFAQRLLAAMSGVPVSRIRARDLERDELSRLAAAADMRRDRLVLEHAHGRTVPQVVRSVRATRRQIGTELVMLDYLQLIPAPARGLSRRERVAQNAELLAEFAGTDNVAVVINSQLNRESEKEGRRPRLSDLRDAGEIEQVGKLILALHDPEGDGPNEDDLEIHVLKNHQGPRARCTVSFDRARCRIS